MKKGVSSIVATVLVILVTVAAISIIWVAVLPLISVEVNSFDPKVNFEIVGLGEYTFYDINNKTVSVSVKRGNDNSEISEIKLILSSNGNTYSKIVEAPKENQAVRYFFDLSNCLFEPEYVSLAPIYIEKGLAKEGMIIKEVLIPKGNVAYFDKVISFC